MGGLGNQMFQYALGRSIAIENKTELSMDVSFLEIRTERKNFTQRDFALDCFNIQTAVSRWPQMGRLKTYFLKKFLRRIIVEQGFPFNPELKRFRDNSLYVGYFQSEKYFLGIRPTLLNDFSLKKSLSAASIRVAEDILATNSVSVHIRRGDYVSNAEVLGFHGICSIDYYHHAIQKIEALQKNIKIFFFSDDINWVRKNLEVSVPCEFIDFNTGDDSFQDLHLMSLCQHNIIANSSFSWWGAWLNTNPSKIVVAPERWFADGSVDTRDLIPNEWIRI
jgi:hypothetical protein